MFSATFISHEVLEVLKLYKRGMPELLKKGMFVTSVSIYYAIIYYL